MAKSAPLCTVITASLLPTEKKKGRREGEREEIQDFKRAMGITSINAAKISSFVASSACPSLDLIKCSGPRVWAWKIMITGPR